MDGRTGDNLGPLIYFLRYTKVCKLLLRSIIELYAFIAAFFLGGRGGIPKKSVYGGDFLQNSRTNYRDDFNYFRCFFGGNRKMRNNNLHT